MMDAYGLRSANRTHKKVVLAYTAYFGAKPWRWMKNTDEFNHWQGIKCPYFSCELTFNRKDRPRSDALIFHARDMPFIDTLRYILERKNANQRWIYFAMESPLNNPVTHRYNDMFNWTMTYRSDSDIYRPYSYYFESTNIPKTSIKEYLKGKDRFVFWTSSRCGLTRDKYVKKLLEYIEVDVYGGCGRDIGAADVGQCPKQSIQCETKLKRYKFQLAFENSYCKDYVTEKYWDGIKKGIVPVVLGGANYTDRAVAIPGSFINVMDFKSVKHLADYLNYLDKNDTAYLEYFHWKSKYRVVDYAPWNCMLCARLHLDSKPKVYMWLDTFWNAKTQCAIHGKLLKQMVRPGPNGILKHSVQYMENY
ncbi:hypothetical protein QZH41_000548 [Actinostola sp. cb2023]|nr:hypothetical protein QZH41_000548 [Actinostola sp. cb2023]